MSHLPVIDTTVQKTYEWLKVIGEELATDNPKVAYAALRATLHALRDHLETDELAQLGAQLPLLIRGIYYEGWDPRHGTPQPRGREAFLAAVARGAQDHPELDDPEIIARVVFDVLSEHVSAGEIAQVIHDLPKNVRELWTDGVA